MNGPMIITIALSAASLVLALMTAAFKLAGAMNRSAESSVEVTASNKALKESLDEFKQTSRAEHAVFHKELDEERVLLAKQGAEIEAHEKTLNNHENRLTLLERKS